MRELKTAIIMTVFFVSISIAFPAILWIVGQVFFHDQANGSLLYNSNGKLVGSRIIGQNFTSAKYFHGRPSAAGGGYDAANSSGTNLGPISSKLIQGIKDNPLTADSDESFPGLVDIVSAYRIENELSPEIKIPADAITHSASGLDPDISVANALLQTNRIARARGIPVSQIEATIQSRIKGRFLAIWGEPRVNVLELNMSLDNMIGRQS